jgi:hypothetical protein
MNTASVTQAAYSLGMTRDAVLKAIRRGTLAATLVPGPTGDGYHIRWTEIERYRDQHRTPRR